MTRIVIITRSFPYLPGEQFIEPEAPFWDRADAEVVVMPWRTAGEPRPVPASVRVDDCLAGLGRSQMVRTRARALAHPLLWQEVAWLLRHRRATRASLQEVLRAVSGALAVRDALADWIERNGPVDVVYTYWWDVWTYGAQLLKGAGVGHVVTRAHRYDLYEDRHPAGHLALKRRLGPQLDAQLAISRDGLEYAREVYGLPDAVVRMSPLGVRIPTQQARPSQAGCLEVMSTAAMVPVKRIDRLVEALGILCGDHPELQVRWTHFGDGPLREELEALLASNARDNLCVALRGNVANDEIRHHLATQPTDLFVNTSASEGVPVSIMEAMAYGVPALAPAVGGIPDLVPATGPGGQLLSEEARPGEVAEVLWQWHERGKEPGQREAAAALVEAGYDEAKNYTSLLDSLVAMG